MQAADVIMGKKDADDAAKDMAKTVGTITAAGGAYQAALTMTRGTTSHLVNTLLRSNVGVLVLQAGIELSQPLKQYVNGKSPGRNLPRMPVTASLPLPHHGKVLNAALLQAPFWDRSA